MMKEIPLTQGKVALVDDKWYDYLMQWKWCAVKNGNTCYAARTYRFPGGRRNIFMHRVILGLTDPKIKGEHKDGNGINNQCENIRSATHQQNIWNKRVDCINNKTGYKGVYVVGNKFMAKIGFNWERIYLGLFENPIGAAKAYNAKAIELYGDFARLNIILDTA